MSTKITDCSLTPWEVLLKITARLAGSENLTEDLFSMVQTLSNVFESDRCSIVLLRKQQKTGVVISSSDDQNVKDLPLDMNKYPEFSRVIDQREPIIISDVTDSKIVKNVLPALLSAHVSSVALFPIAHKKIVYGVIFFRFKTRKKHLKKQDIMLCQIVANATAIALRNNEILASLKKKTEEVKQVQNEARSQLAELKPYEDFFTNSVDGIVVLSDTGVVVFINTEGIRMLNLPISSVRGLPFTKLLKKSDLDNFEQLLDAAVRKENRSVDFSFQSNDNLDRLLSISAGVLGAEGMILLTMRDVTYDRLTALRLMEVQKRLIENEKQAAMIEVAGAAAHELNQPLTSILTSMAMIRKLIPDIAEKHSNFVSVIEREVDRMASIVKRLSTLTDYTTKSYVGKARIIDLDRAAAKVDPEKEND